MNRERGSVLDASVVLLLVAVALSVLDDTFADRSYLVTGLVPVVLLLGLAVLFRRVHEGVWWYALAAVVLFAPLGAWVALRRPGPYVLPTFETMNRVLGESISAPTTLVSTVPPVDPSGQVMLVPFLIGFLAAAPAAWLALATRRSREDALDDATLPPSSAAQPERSAIQNERLAALSRALDRLKEDQRRCWLLREVAELSYAEIAEEMNMTDSTVRGLLARARASIAIEMEGWR